MRGTISIRQRPVPGTRNQSEDLSNAERLYLQSSKEFDKLLEKTRTEVQRCRRRGNSGKSMVEAEATLKSTELDAALGHYQLGAFYFTHCPNF
jgi:hypothetical protein